MTVLLLVPLLYLVTTLGRVQAAAFAAEGAAQAAARAAAVAGVDLLEGGASDAEAIAAAQGTAQAVVALSVEDFGLDADDASLTMSCTADPCLAPGSDVRAHVTIAIGLPGIPGFLTDAGLVVALDATASSPVDDLAGAG
ncbi:hypothetical protein [Demequina sp. NBRC 110054]|uniref:hypothetical protein n=1 Tax=Demequina sp. NBRC 110054 TaxID=1570343 RepID=UPI000A05317E|nr:hypothetical protein [Demequina sp. NBRC 110054]